MSWHTGTLLAVDTETTGTNPAEARIVTAAAVTVDVSAGAVDTRTWLANPGVDIPAESSAVHGITTEQAREHGQPAYEVLAELFELIGDTWCDSTPIVAFNAAFDLTVLANEASRHLLDFYSKPGPVVDPLVLDRALVPRRKGKRRLADVCGHYNVALTDAEAHTSAGDALAAARLAWCLGNAFPRVASMALDELHEYQVKAHKAWAEEFEQWLRGRKKADGASPQEVEAVVIEREWPLREVSR